VQNDVYSTCRISALTFRLNCRARCAAWRLKDSSRQLAPQILRRLDWAVVRADSGVTMLVTLKVLACIHRYEGYLHTDMYVAHLLICLSCEITVTRFNVPIVKVVRSVVDPEHDASPNLVS